MVKYHQVNPFLTYEQMNLINDFRALWTELSLWTRSYMVSSLTGFSNIEAIRGQINRIPEELAKKLQPFLGVELSERFQYLLSLYLYHTQAYIDEKKNSDQQAADRAVALLYGDADSMADFLSLINAYWSRDQWQNLFYQQIESTIAQLTALLSGEFEREIEIRDQKMKLALVLGDYIAHGVIHYLTPTLP